MAGNKIASTRANISLRGTMSRISGEPIDAAAKANVLGLSLIRGASLLLMLGLLIWGWMTSNSRLALPLIFFLYVVGFVAWVALRGRGGPLQFGPAGVVIGVSTTMLYVARVSAWSGRTTKLLGSWPREEVRVTPTVSRTSSLRGFQLQFAGVELPARLELVQSRGRENALDALFGAPTP